MGIITATYKTDVTYGGHVLAKDDFAFESNGRLRPAAGEVFETIPQGCLEVLAFTHVRSVYHASPYTVHGMRWEVGFSAHRVYFFSPEINALFGGLSERRDQATLGFYYYPELRSLSLGSSQEPGGSYVSSIFIIQATPTVQVPIGIRVHGTAKHLHAFATLLVARLVEDYARLAPALGLDLTELGILFEGVNAFDYTAGIQTDFFLAACGNRLGVEKATPFSS